MIQMLRAPGSLLIPIPFLLAAWIAAEVLRSTWQGIRLVFETVYANPHVLGAEYGNTAVILMLVDTGSLIAATAVFICTKTRHRPVWKRTAITLLAPPAFVHLVVPGATAFVITAYTFFRWREFGEASAAAATTLTLLLTLLGIGTSLVALYHKQACRNEETS